MSRTTWISLLVAFTLSACGEEVPYAAPALEDIEAWRGIDAASGPRTETAAMTAIRSIAVDTPNQVVEIGDLEWRVITIEELRRGVAQTWADIDDRWVAARIRITPIVRDTTVGIIPRDVILSDALVLIDEEGNRRLPLKVHERLEPRIDLPYTIDTNGLEVAVIFPVKRGIAASALEIHYPLGDARMTWGEIPMPSEWIALDQRAVLEDKSLLALWDLTLRRVRFLEDRTFLAELTLRNVASGGTLLPDPAAARLYLGSGRTLQSVSLSESRVVPSGRTARLTLRFTGVPARESLEIVIPYGDTAARLAVRIPSLPGFWSENPIPMARPVLAQGIRAVVYKVEKNAGAFSVRFGLTNNGGDALDASGMTVRGLTSPGGAPVDGVIRERPAMLYPTFEERRWIDFPREVAALQIEIPGKSSIRVKI